MSGIKVQEYIDQYHSAAPFCRVLDIGCGLHNEYRLPAQATLLGLDLLESSLIQNSALSGRVVGDAQALPFKPAQFDIVFCTYVLEHLPHPQHALLGMCAVTKAGGLLVLDFPNLYSLKSLLAKITPLWFHHWVYRFILKGRQVGSGGQTPFKTYFHPSMRLENVLAVSQAHGFRLLSMETQDARALLALHSAPFYRLYDLIERFLNRLLGGKLNDSEITLVLQKLP